MNAKNAIEKLQQKAREKEVLKSEHRQRQEEEKKIVEKNRSRRGVEKNRYRNVEYSTVGCKVTVAFIIIFRMC
jgi:hypothetical protein